MADSYRVAMSAEERAEVQAARVAAEQEAWDQGRLAAEISRLALLSDDELLDVLDGTLVGLESVPLEDRGSADRTTRLRALARLLRLTDVQVEERRVMAVANAAAVTAAAVAERDAQHPTMRAQFPDLAPAWFIATRAMTVRGRTFARGEAIDVCEFAWPAMRLEKMVRIGRLLPDPQHLEACAKACAVNGGRMPQSPEDTPKIETMIETVESPEDRKRRQDRERQARRRAKAKEATK